MRQPNQIHRKFGRNFKELLIMVKTPSDKWNSNIVKLRKNCQNILKLSKKIRYVGVINQYGRTMTGMLRSDTKPLLNTDHTKNEFFLISSLLNMRREFVKPIGKLDHITIQHDKVYIVLLQKNNYVYYISIESDVQSISNLILKIKRTI